MRKIPSKWGDRMLQYLREGEKERVWEDCSVHEWNVMTGIKGRLLLWLPPTGVYEEHESEQTDPDTDREKDNDSQLTLCWHSVHSLCLSIKTVTTVQNFASSWWDTFFIHLIKVWKLVIGLHCTGMRNSKVCCIKSVNKTAFRKHTVQKWEWAKNYKHVLTLKQECDLIKVQLLTCNVQPNTDLKSSLI